MRSMATPYITKGKNGLCIGAPCINAKSGLQNRAPEYDIALQAAYVQKSKHLMCFKQPLAVILGDMMFSFRISWAYLCIFRPA